MQIGAVGPWVVSIAALVQPWIIKTWKRWRATVQLFESGNIEIGYSTSGPTVALNGTLRARHKDFFVRSLRVRITRKRDNLTRQLDWLAFRSHKFTPGESSVELELPHSFLLTEELPQNYNIVFADQAFIADNKAKVESIVPPWQDFRRKEGVTPQSPLEAVEDAFGKFVATGATLDAFRLLDRASYWSAGEFSLDVDVLDADGNARTLGRFEFELTADDETRLRDNGMAVIRVVAGLPVIWAFAYPKYRRPTDLIGKPKEASARADHGERKRPRPGWTPARGARWHQTTLVWLLSRVIAERMAARS